MFVLTEYILLGALGFGCVLGPMVCEREAIQPYLGPLWNTGEGEENRRNGKTQERKASSIPLESLRRCCGYSFLPWAPTECYVSCGYSETTLVPLEWFLCFSSAFQRHADVSTGIFSYSFNCPVIQRGLNWFGRMESSKRWRGPPLPLLFFACWSDNSEPAFY